MGDNELGRKQQSLLGIASADTPAICVTVVSVFDGGTTQAKFSLGIGAYYACPAAPQDGMAATRSAEHLHRHCLLFWTLIYRGASGGSLHPALTFNVNNSR